MKAVVWLVVVIVIAAAVVFGVTTAQRSRIETDLEAAADITDADARIAEYVRLAQTGRATSEQIETISDGIAEAAYERGEGRGLVAVSDSLLGLELPAELRHRLTGELHDGLVVQGYYEEDEKRPYWARASEVARDILDGEGVPPEVQMHVASFHGYSLDFVEPAELMAANGHWLPYELASTGFACLESPVSTSDTAILSTTLGWALTRTREAFGVERGIAATDSLLAAGPCPSIRTVILENRYAIAVDHDPELALDAARGVLEVGQRPGMWPLLRAVSLDITERELDPGLALELANASLELAESRADSGNVLYAVGLAQSSLENYDEAALALEGALAVDEEVPELDDPRVESLLSVYDESSNSEGAITLLSRLLARSIVDNEDLTERLAELLVADGRSREEIPALVEAQRYAGVRQAPDFTLIDRAGNDVPVLSLRGNVVLLCFWSYG